MSAWQDIFFSHFILSCLSSCILLFHLSILNQQRALKCGQMKTMVTGIKDIFAVVENQVY